MGKNLQKVPRTAADTEIFSLLQPIPCRMQERWVGCSQISNLAQVVLFPCPSTSHGQPSVQEELSAWAAQLNGVLKVRPPPPRK